MSAPGETAAPVEIVVNGADVTVEAKPSDTLLETLRGELGLMSVRGSCGIGICGTCTVLVDGLPVCSCITLTVMHRSSSITTSEGLAGAGELDTVQRAFIDHGAFQCSYCIPAMALTVRALLDDDADVPLESIREELAGNLCRCGSYPQIMAAVESLLDQDDPRWND